MHLRQQIDALRVCTILFVGALAQSCAGDSAPPVASPSLVLSRDQVVLGGPIATTYRFTVAATAPELTEDYRVFVHFLDSDGELMWTDDHEPAVPTSQWRPGQIVTYRRQHFAPIYPYVGQASIALGLYSPTTSERLPLSGDHLGQRAYQVAALELLPQSEGVFLIYKEGWHPAEYLLDAPNVEWQWTEKEATISFRNPQQDSTLYLHLEGRADLFDEPPHAAVAIGDRTIETFELTSTGPMLRTIALSAADFGSDGMVDLKIQVDKTFVPAQITSADQSGDERELGVRVFHAFIEPL